MNGANDVLLVQGGPDDLTDNALRQLLARAPDRGVLPDWQLRQTILTHAHDAVADQQALLHALREPAPWWRLDSWWKKGEGRALTPWTAAGAVVLLASSIAVLWHREPAHTVSVEAERITPKTPLAPTPASSARLDNALAPVTPNGSRATPAPTAAARTEAAAPPSLRSPAPDPFATPPAGTSATTTAGGNADAIGPQATQRAPGLPAGNVSADPHKTISAAAPSSAPPASGKPLDTAKSDKLALRPLAPAAASAPTTVTAAKPMPPVDPAAALAPSSTGQAAGSAAAPPARPGERTDETPPPSFAALSQWTDMRISYEGQSRTVSRAKARELALLVGSAAIVADGPQRVRARTPWRVTLLRSGKPLAVLAIAQGQVQWTEGKAPPASGTPPPGSLDALRGALNMALEAPPDQPANLPLADRLERELAQPPRVSAGQGAAVAPAPAPVAPR